MDIQEKKDDTAKQTIPALKEIIEERKEKAIDELSTSYAKNRLPLEEYERLVEYIHKIESERELAVVEKIVAEYTGKEEAEKPAYTEDDAEYYDEDDELQHGNNFVSGSNLTVLSSRTFSGPVKSGSQFASILGSGSIKVRKKDLGKRRTVLNVTAILGDFLISVEGGIKVTNKVVPILGNAGVNHKVAKLVESGGPELVIKGMAFLGDVSVKLLKD